LKRSCIIEVVVESEYDDLFIFTVPKAKQPRVDVMGEFGVKFRRLD
jgi:hypothetical protein